jgi:hypothetical protein
MNPLSHTVRNGLTEKFQTWKSAALARESFVVEKGKKCNTHGTDF